MALYKLFTGNVVDLNAKPLTAFRYKGFHKPTKTWSEWYSSNNQAQYNFNIGDAAWLTQNGSVSVGDSVLIVVETLETKPTDRAFAMIEMTISTADTYVQDIQLKTCMPPNVKSLWSLVSPTDTGLTITDASNTDRIIYVGRVNESIGILESYNDEHTYSYNSKPHKHVLTYYGETIFNDRLGILTYLTDWNTGKYVTDEEHVFTSTTTRNTGGYIPIKVKVTNKSEQTVIDTLYLQVRNNKPKVSLTWEPINPSIKDDFVLTSTISDNDNALISATYYLDGNKISTSKLKSFMTELSLGTLYIKERPLKATIEWSDGFTTLSFDYITKIEMTNLPPKFTLTRDTTVKSSVRVKLVDLANPDGNTNNVRIKWSVGIKLPGATDYVSFISTDYPTTPNDRYKDFALTLACDYRITAYAIDESGGVSSSTYEFTIDATSDSKQKFRLEWE